jgi:hypothetical protein
MPRCGIVGLLVFALVVNGCAGSSRVIQPAAPPDSVIVLNQPPRQPEHPFRDWCKAHPVTVGAVTGLLVVVGAIGALGALAGPGVGH